MYKILTGDCRDILPTLEPNSVDAVVTDPPYELNFMAKNWDRTGVAFDPDTWRVVLDVMKPGAFMLCFGGTRTEHRMTCAIEDAGFEIRDKIIWLYGSGFPKSLDVSKALDNAAGAEREVVGSRPIAYPDSDCWSTPNKNVPAGDVPGWGMRPNNVGGERPVTAPATDLARQWHGWGTALKPAYEPIILARKPLIGTVAENVIEYGTGGLNIDGCRIGTGDDRISGGKSGAITEPLAYGTRGGGIDRPTCGRWPANVILDEESAAMLDAQSGERPSGTFPGRTQKGNKFSGRAYNNGKTYHGQQNHDPYGYGDTGGASRFFYTAKASRSERNAGLDGMPLITPEQMTGRKENSPGLVMENGKANPYAGTTGEARQNHHPTVKPISLMQYLCRIITPPNGLILDPFTGSGSTGVAANREGFQFIGTELSPEYVAIAIARIKAAQNPIGWFEGWEDDV